MVDRKTVATGALCVLTSACGPGAEPAALAPTSGGSGAESGAGAAANGGSSGVGGSSGAGGSSGGAAGAGWNCEPGAPEGPSVSAEEPGIVVSLGGIVIEFREDVLTYGGRSPLLDMSAFATGAALRSFRLMVGPRPGESSVVASDYYCSVGFAYMMANAGAYATDYGEGGCTVRVTEAALGAGSPFSGTFCATLGAGDGSGSLEVVRGSFFGLVEP